MGARSKGASETNLAPVWDMLRAQKPYIGFVAGSSAQAVPYMENEQVWLMPFWSARALLYAKRGLPYGVTIPKEGTIALANCCAIPIGAANKKLAFEFINFRLDPDIQRAFCVAYQASPARPDITDWPGRFCRTADYHRREDGHDGVSRRSVDRPEATGMDAAMAGDHVGLRGYSVDDCEPESDTAVLILAHESRLKDSHL